MKKTRKFFAILLVMVIATMTLVPEVAFAIPTPTAPLPWVPSADEAWSSPEHYTVSRAWCEVLAAHYYVTPEELIKLYESGEWNGSWSSLDCTGKVVVSATYRGLDYHADMIYFTKEAVTKDNLSYISVPEITYGENTYEWCVTAFEREYMPEFGMYRVYHSLSVNIPYYFDLPGGSVPEGQALDLEVGHVTLFDQSGVCTWQPETATLNFWSKGELVESWELPEEAAAGGHELRRVATNPYLLTTKYLITLAHDGKYIVVSDNVLGVIPVNEPYNSYDVICTYEEDGRGLCYWRTDETVIELHSVR